MTAAQPPGRASGRSLLLTIVASVAGLALLVWQIDRVGLDEVVQGFAAIGNGLLAVLVLSFGRFALRAGAWRTLIPERVKLGTIIGATLAGDALGNLTPLSILVGEPAKAMYLRGQVGVSRALATLTAENFFYSVSVAIYVILGTAAMLVAFPVPAALSEAGVIALVMMAAVLAVASWMAWQRPSIVSAVVSRLPSRRARAAVEGIRAFELETYGSAGREGGRIVVVAVLETLFHALSFAEVWLVLWLLTGRSLVLEAFVLDTFSRIVNVVFKVVPLRLGVEQTVASTVAATIGLTSGIGLNLALVRTGRMLVWTTVGLVLLARRGLTSPADPRSPSTS